jgi:hypothetical protein
MRPVLETGFSEEIGENTRLFSDHWMQNWLELIWTPRVFLVISDSMFLD